MITLTQAQAHTSSVGYENSGPGSVTFWYGTYHAGTSFTEGSLSLVGQDVTYNATTAFTVVTGVRPTGLVDGVTNFYSDGTQLTGTDFSGGILAWQGVSFTNLVAGTYVFTYVPIAFPTSTWRPIDNIILSSQVTLSAAVVGQPPEPPAPTAIDASQAFFTERDAATARATITFAGGTLAPTHAMSFSQRITLLAVGGTVDTSAGDVGFLSALSGDGALTKIGVGALRLSGANTYSGGTIVTGGTLIGDATSLQGSMINNAVLVFDQAVDGTFSGAISGTGVLVKEGAGTLVLEGANTSTGGVTINAGVLVGDTTSLTGPVVNNATLMFDQGGDGAFSGAMSGSGLLIKEGGGTLILKGANTSSGGVRLNAGVLAIGDETALGSGRITAGGGALRLDYAGTLAQNVDVQQAGLVIDTGDHRIVASGAYSGSGGLTKLGSGLLDLTGDGSMTGAVTVRAGRLAVNGSLAGAVASVEDGAEIGGNGALGGLIVRTHATAAPGNSIGQLNAANFAIFEAGSSYAVEVSPAGANDRIVVGGEAALEGGVVRVLAQPGEYRPVTTYTILDAGGGVTGRFEGAVSDLSFLSPELTYTANGVALTLIRNDLMFSGLATTGNQARVGVASDQAFPFGSAVYDSLVRGTAATARDAFDQLSGEAHASTLASAISDGAIVRGALLDRLSGPSDRVAGPGRNVTVWASVIGGWSRAKADGGTASLDRDLYGALVGAEAVSERGARVGLAAGFDKTTVDVPARRASSEIRTNQVWAYGSADIGRGLALRGGLGYADLDIAAERTVALPGTSAERLTSKGGASVVQLFGELSRRMTFKGMRLEPLAGLAASWIKTDDFQEQGGALALRGYSVKRNLTQGTLGVRTDRTLGASDAVTVRLDLAWRHALRDMDPTVRLAFQAGGQPFDVAATRIDRDSLVVDAGMVWQVTGKLSASAVYKAAIGKRAEDHALRGSLSYRF